MYLYELHCHTSDGSKCARLHGEEVAALYAEHGYSGVVITDHFYAGNTAVDRNLPWNQWVEQFCKGFERALEEGKKRGLQVFFGWEYCDKGAEILTYGLTKEWLLKHPELSSIGIVDYCKLVKSEGGIAVQAHPFRQRSYTNVIHLVPRWTDYAETVNKCNTPSENLFADQYADNYGLKKIGGTDLHKMEHAACLGGLALPAKVGDIFELFCAVDAGRIRIL